MTATEELLSRFRNHLATQTAPTLVRVFTTKWEAISSLIDTLYALSDDDKAGGLLKENDVFALMQDRYRRTKQQVDEEEKISEKCVLVRQFSMLEVNNIKTDYFEAMAEWLAEEGFDYKGYISKKKHLFNELVELSGWSRKIKDMVDFLEVPLEQYRGLILYPSKQFMIDNVELIEFPCYYRNETDGNEIYQADDLDSTVWHKVLE